MKTKKLITNLREGGTKIKKNKKKRLFSHVKVTIKLRYTSKTTMKKWSINIHIGQNIGH